MFGNPEITTGGKALKFYATIRLDIRRIETLKDGTEVVGNRCRVKVVKNKVAPPFKQAEFDIMYGQGISREGTLLDLGVLYDVVAKSGAFFSYNDERLGQGRANAKVFLKENPDIADAIEAQIRSKAGLPGSVPQDESAAAVRHGRPRGRRPGHRRGPQGLAVPVVTALRATRRGGVALHVDDEYVCVVSESLVARWRLFKGRELSADDVAQVRAASSAERVKGDAYRLLGHRARSTQELRRRLLAKEHDEATVDEALEQLAADGFLDDAAFARSYVADKRRLDGWGVDRIRRGLRELGVDAAVVDEALGEGAADDGAELDRALDRAAQARCAGAAAGRGPPARVPGSPATRLLLVDRLRRRAHLGRGIAAPAELTRSAAVTYHRLTRRVRALCVFHFSLLHGDTDGGRSADQAENRTTRGR